MARFKGNTHAGSDRAAATFLFLVLLIAVLLAAWWIADPVFRDNLMHWTTTNR